jgi:tight adherence protein C
LSRLKIYEFILLAPAFIFSLRLILSEIVKGISVIDYTERQLKIKNIISIITRSKPNQNTLNEELSSILLMSSIMISAGESPISSLKYIADRSNGVLPRLISKELGALESEGNLLKTLDYLAISSGSKQVKRVGNSLQVAINRGSPLLQVIHNQVSSINKEIHVRLLRKSGQSEIALLIPVVFLILPVSILFAIWPSIYGLNMSGL